VLRSGPDEPGLAIVRAIRACARSTPGARLVAAWSVALNPGSLDYFELMAECSVALGGFAAVPAVLRGSTGPRGTFRAWGSVTYGFSALLMSLAPLLVAAGGLLDAASRTAERQDLETRPGAHASGCFHVEFADFNPHLCRERTRSVRLRTSP
jgi:hypothetical protein